MSKIDRLKEDIIESVNETTDEKLLLSIIDFINCYEDEKFYFTPAQVEVLKKSRRKTDNNDLISGDDLELLDESG